MLASETLTLSLILTQAMMGSFVLTLPVALSLCYHLTPILVFMEVFNHVVEQLRLSFPAS